MYEPLTLRPRQCYRCTQCGLVFRRSARAQHSWPRCGHLSDLCVAISADDYRAAKALTHSQRTSAGPQLCLNFKEVS